MWCATSYIKLHITAHLCPKMCQDIRNMQWSNRMVLFCDWMPRGVNPSVHEQLDQGWVLTSHSMFLEVHHLHVQCLKPLNYKVVGETHAFLLFSTILDVAVSILACWVRAVISNLFALHWWPSKVWNAMAINLTMLSVVVFLVWSSLCDFWLDERGFKRTSSPKNENILTIVRSMM